MKVSIGLPTDSRACMLPVITLGALRLTGGMGQPAVFDFATILPFRVSFITGNCTAGDWVLTVIWKHVGLTISRFSCLGMGFTGMSHTEMYWRRETMVLFLLLNWIYDVILIFFLNPQRNSAAIEESLLSCAGGDWLGVIWPNSPARLLSKKDYWCWNYWSVHLSNRRALPVWF